MRQILFFILLFFTAGFTIAQSPELLFKGFVHQDSILLRWAPTNTHVFIKGLKEGYNIERSEKIDFSDNTTIFEIDSYQTRRETYKNDTSTQVKFFDELILNLVKTTNDEAQNYAYFSLILAAGSNRLLAKMLGVFYSDFPSENNLFYYRIKLKSSQNWSENVILKSGEESVNPEMSTLSGISKPKRKEVYLSWESKTLEKDYSAYWIERSTDSINFTRRNSVPYIFVTSSDEPNKTYCDYVDTGVVEGVTYYYRIQSINHFALEGDVSNLIKIKVPISIKGIIKVDSVAVENELRKVHIRTEVENDFSEIDSIILFMSDSLMDGYKRVNACEYSAIEVVFTQNVGITSGDRYYYKAAIVSIDGDTVYSYPKYFFTLDQIPPHIPDGLVGEINDSGIVKLNWHLNADTDIRGYKVYRANSLKEEFIEITKVFNVDGHFIDTVRLNNLTPELYYRVEAVDLNYNHSGKSEPILILKPDTIPPVPAVLKFYETSSKGVELKWENSSSKDIKYHWLVREHNGELDTLDGWVNELNFFNDSTGISGTQYYYYIICIDAHKNKSVCPPLLVNYETGKRPGVSNIETKVNREEKNIFLKWELPKSEIYSVQIYRSVNDGKYVLYKTLKGPITEFIDTSLSINNVYHYKIKIVYKDGSYSGLSIPISVTY